MTEWFFMRRVQVLGMGLLLFMLSAATVSIQAVEELPQEERAIAFPGAEGFGKYTTGGRGGRTIIVTNLNDDGPGSLRAAIREEGPRIIVFEVDGTIVLKSSLDIHHGDLTIAGQSAPGDGICLRDYPLKVKTGNVIIRYVRGRLGDEQAVQDDGISIIGQRDIIIDHCSFSWGTDEVATFYDNQNFTLQWCIVSESLNNSVHQKGEHGYGGIWGGQKASFHHNLLAHHKSRNPRFCGARYHKQPETEIVDFRNNVIYNWRSNGSYGGEQGNHNVVANYYKPGPATKDSKSERILNPWEPYGTFYVTGNVLSGNEVITSNNSLGVELDGNGSPLVNVPIEVEPVETQTASEAYEAILANAGASLCRDSVDRRIIEETRSGTAQFGVKTDGIIDTQSEVGGWPLLQSTKPLADTDRDGMPDSWETAQKLNLKDALDATAFTLSKSFTNLEVYLNERADEHIPN